MGKFSREKGRRGEQQVAKLVAGKRVGVAYAKTAVDVESSFAQYQVKNRPIGAGAILTCLKEMEVAGLDKKNLYVVFKACDGVWLIAERLTQHQADHVGGVNAERD